MAINDAFRNLPRVWENNMPYPEVLSGVLPENVFAADLTLVRVKKAASIYQNSQEFFEKTHMTRALRTLILDITKKLNGTAPDADSIYKLETSFGGGKTHCLIALYHVFSEEITNDIVKEILEENELPSKTKVVCLDGTEYNCEKGNSREKGVTVRTLWGDLAYQLDGKVGYELIRENDENRTSPGAELIGTLLGEDPILILIDELSLYYEKASAISVGSSSLERQTNTFLYDLLRAVSTKANAAVVLTLASSQDAFGKWIGTINQAIAEAHSIIARKAKVLFPTEEDEMYGVIRRRLFSSWDASIGKDIAKAYIELYRQYDEIPDAYKTPDYQEKIEKSYPFHPELLNILESRISSIAIFQKTRGALRLLAKVIKDVWTRNEEDIYVILPGNVSLENEAIKNELTGKIGKEELIPVIHADIATNSGNAKSQEIDKSYVDKGLPPLATRIANCIFLNSLIFGEMKGRDKNSILIGTLTPGVNPDVIISLISKMTKEYWYLKDVGDRLFFDSQPTIAKILQDYMKIVGPGEVRARIQTEIEKLFKGSYFSHYIQPNGPSDVKDDMELKLLIMDYETVNFDSKDDPIPEVIQQIWDYEKNNRPRVYKNTLFFMVGANNLISRLNDVAQEYEAYKKMEEYPEDLESLSQHQRDELEALIKQSDQELSISVANVYRFLVFPQKDNLTCVEFDPKAIGETNKTRQEIIIEHLIEEGKYKTTISPQYVKNKAWPSHLDEVSTDTFRSWFYQFFSLPIPQKLDVLRATIKQGVNDKLWILKVGTKCYVSGEKISNIPFSKDAILYTIDRAIELELCDSKGEKCPNCKNWPCICEPISESDEIEPPKLGTKPLRPSIKPPTPKAKQKKFSWAESGLVELLLPNYQKKVEEEKPTFLEKMTISVKSILGAQALNTLLIHLPKAQETIVDMEVDNPDSGQILRKFKLSFGGQTDQFSTLFSNLKTYIETYQLVPEIKVTLTFEKKKFEHINSFLNNLKNYHKIEFTLRISGFYK